MLTLIGKSSDIVSTLVASFDRTIHKDWSNCLDRRQVWNQKRPPWFEALHHMIYPLLSPIANILISSMQTGATIYQVSHLFVFFFEIINNSLATFHINDKKKTQILHADNGSSNIMPNGNA